MQVKIWIHWFSRSTHLAVTSAGVFTVMWFSALVRASPSKWRYANVGDLPGSSNSAPAAGLNKYISVTTARPMRFRQISARQCAGLQIGPPSGLRPSRSLKSTARGWAPLETGPLADRKPPLLCGPENRFHCLASRRHLCLGRETGKAAGRRFGRPDPCNGARRSVVEPAIAHHPRHVERPPGGHPIGADMPADNVAAGGPIRQRKVRFAALPQHRPA
jgi:hypothetical protein